MAPMTCNGDSSASAARNLAPAANVFAMGFSFRCAHAQLAILTDWRVHQALWDFAKSKSSPILILKGGPKPLRRSAQCGRRAWVRAVRLRATFATARVHNARRGTHQPLAAGRRSCVVAIHRRKPQIGTTEIRRQP